jgi:hypothetical protein
LTFALGPKPPAFNWTRAVESAIVRLEFVRGIHVHRMADICQAFVHISELSKV